MLPGHHSPRISALQVRPRCIFGWAVSLPVLYDSKAGGKVTMILAPLAAAALLATVATAPHANPTLLPALSMHQRSAAMQPLMRSATECIARTVGADPRFSKPNADLGHLIV